MDDDTLTKPIWEKIYGFGRHSHIIDPNRKTLCGRDISMQKTTIQNNPPRKCIKCENISTLFDKIKELEKSIMMID